MADISQMNIKILIAITKMTKEKRRKRKTIIVTLKMALTTCR
jgi:hypothetical protein